MTLLDGSTTSPRLTPLGARRTIESLRSGVPGREAVSQLETTQRGLRSTFEKGLTALAEDRPVDPLVLSANFGAGKTHLLEYLEALAERRGFVTSYVVVSPEMPLGSPHVVLKAIAEAAVAPGRVGCALSALADDLGSHVSLAALRGWAIESGLDGRFAATAHLYEKFRADEELRWQILDDLQGRPLSRVTIKQKLKEIGEARTYAMGRTHGALLARDRIRMLARFYRSAGAQGWVVLFDEIERMGRFSLKQRVAAYEELGWWKEIAAQEGAAIYPVFAMTTGFLQETVTGGSNDAQRLEVDTRSGSREAGDRRLCDGIALLKTGRELAPTTPSEEAEIAERLRQIYEAAYGIAVPPVTIDVADAWLVLRTKIRRWITRWDLLRYDPAYVAEVSAAAVEFDEASVPEVAMDGGEDES